MRTIYRDIEALSAAGVPVAAQPGEGYRLVEGVPWSDALYMTVITITTVGFGHVFPLSRAGEALRVRMIERMSGHDIVCGYGRMGRAAVDALRRAGRQVVVIEARVEQTEELAATGRPVVTGDATREASLRAANVEHARGLVCCLADDAHNLYTVLTARSLNPDLVIAARAAGEGAEQRILQAGADRVVNPYQLGGARLAHLLVEPPGSGAASSSGPPEPADPASTGASRPAPDNPSLSEP